MGKTGETKFCSQILDGTAIIPPGTPTYTTEFLHQLQRNPTATSSQFQHSLSSDDFRNGWNKIKETTSSASKTGLHFGHLKACASNPLLAEFESSISHIPFTTGYVPTQWKEGLIVMIKKKAGLNTVHSLRSIVLTEADFNFNNKVLGRRAIQQAENLNDIAPEQYGSRKHKSAIDQALHKRLSYDIMRQMKTPGLLCSNDAKSCYDRVLHSIASLAYQRIGIPHPPVHCMLQCIQEMNHQIKTNFGISEECLHKRYTAVPLQGILQGNGASPTTWVLISTPLLNMLRAKGNGAKFVSPISHEHTHIVGFAFVDDTDLITFDMEMNTVDWDEITHKMQEAIDRWEGGLKSTGGAIVPSKSWIYPIKFSFDDKGKASYLPTSEIDHEFTVADAQGQRVPLRSFDPHIGMETLGVVLAPDGNNKDALTSLAKKASTWSANIKFGHLSSSLAWHAASTTIMKSLEYPLPALTLTYKECNKIMTIVKKGLFNASRICTAMPNDVVYGPVEEGGLNLHHLYTTQGLFQIEKFVKFLSTDTITGKLLRVTYELCILEVGIGRNLFDLPFHQFGFLLSDSWIKHLWKFTDSRGISITDRTTIFPLQARIGDVFLMEAFSEQGYSTKQMLILNRCRIHLQVLQLSDIMNGYGNGFTEIIRGTRVNQRIITYKWPLQPPPSTQMLKFWKKALRKTFGLVAGVTSYKLGRWLNNDFSHWIWFYHSGSQSIMQRFGNVWRMWTRETSRGRMGPNSKFKYFTIRHRIPASVKRATVRFWSPSRITLTGWADSENNTTITFSHSIPSPSLHTEILVTDENNMDLSPHLTQGAVNIVCDGSFLPDSKTGAAAWVIETTDKSIQLTGATGTTGPLDCQTACRSELFGILYSILHLKNLCSNLVLQTTSFHIHCDGLSAIQSIENTINLHNCTKKILTSSTQYTHYCTHFPSKLNSITSKVIKTLAQLTTLYLNLPNLTYLLMTTLNEKHTLYNLQDITSIPPPFHSVQLTSLLLIPLGTKRKSALISFPRFVQKSQKDPPENTGSTRKILT